MILFRKPVGVTLLISGCLSLSGCFINSSIQPNILLSSVLAPGDGQTMEPSFSEIQNSITFKKVFPSIDAAAGKQGSALKVVVQAQGWSSAISDKGYKVFVGGVEAAKQLGTDDVFEVSVILGIDANTLDVEIKKDSETAKKTSVAVKNSTLVDCTNSFDIAVSPNGTKGYCIGWSKDLVEIDLTNGQRKKIYSNPTTLYAQRGVVSGDGTKLFFGGNTFSVLQFDLSNNTLSDLSSGSRGTGNMVSWVNGMVQNTLGTKLYVVEQFLGYITEINIFSGNRTTISSDGSWLSGRGSGPVFGLLRGAALSLDGTKLYTGSMSNGDLFEVDIATGNRSIRSSSASAIGSGPVIGGPVAFLNQAGTKIYSSGRTMLEIDLSNGNRTEFSGPNLGNGSAFYSAQGMAYSSLNNFTYVMDMRFGEVIKVNMATGDRSVLKEYSVGSGPDIISASKSYESDDGAKTIVLTYDGIYEIQHSSGLRTSISDKNTGSGVLFSNLTDFVVLPNSNWIYVLDAGYAGNLPNYVLYKVSRSNGQRVVVSGGVVGTGPAIDQFSYGLNVNSSGTSAYILNSSTPSVIKIDLTTGNRSVLSSGSTGSGPMFLGSYNMALSSDGNTLYICDVSNNQFIAVDVVTGNRTIIASNSVGSGAVISGLSSIQILSNSKIYFSANGRVYSLDAATGNRTLFFDTTNSFGLSYANYWFGSIDSFGRIYRPAGGGLLELNTKTGERLIISR